MLKKKAYINVDLKIQQCNIYSFRWTYAEFFQRYRVLAKSKLIHKNDMRKTCEAILPALIAVSLYIGLGFC
jgi:myosin heavy subunit